MEPLRFVRRVDRLCVAVAAVLAFVAILPDAEDKVDGMYYTGHRWPCVSCVRRRALNAENVLRHRDNTCSASCYGEYSIRSIRILLRWLTNVGWRAALEYYKYGCWLAALLLQVRYWRAAILSTWYYYGREFCIFYIAHIVHYSPIYLPAARINERRSTMVPGGNGNLRNW